MNRRVRICAAAAFALMHCIVASASSQGVVAFRSDLSWSAYELNPDYGAGSFLGMAQFETWYAYPAELSTIPGAAWIWKPGVDANSPADLQGVWLAKEIVVPGAPIEAYVSIAVDDAAEVFVNGVSVGTTGSTSNYSAAAAAQSSLVRFDVTPFVQAGSNLIQFRAQNGPASFAGGRCNPCNYGGNQAGVVFGGEIHYALPVPTRSSTWGQIKQRYR